jgi:hypothetical protein
MKVISIGLLLVLSLALPSHAQAFDENCRPNSSEEWSLKKTYEFTYQGKAYKLIWSQMSPYGDGSFCLAQGKTIQPIATKYINTYAVDRLDRLSPQVFTFQVHDGNGTNVPVRKYRLDLSNPQQPKVKLLKQWRE